jgi:hypothetical protein
MIHVWEKVWREPDLLVSAESNVCNLPLCDLGEKVEKLWEGPPKSQDRNRESPQSLLNRQNK